MLNSTRNNEAQNNGSGNTASHLVVVMSNEMPLQFKKIGGKAKMIEKLIKVDDSDYPYRDDANCAWQCKTDYIKIQVLGFCGCGNSSEVMRYVKDFLVRISKRDYGNYEDMPYMFLCYWADHNEFAEHGSTARCCWLTDKGNELLKDIEWCIENEKESDNEE